jgi:hypothetical protein
MQHMDAIYEIRNTYTAQGLMVMHDDEYNQGLLTQNKKT